MLAAGYLVGGKDPVASFLTNVRDSPAVVSASGPGYYRLDPDRREPLSQQRDESEQSSTTSRPCSSARAPGPGRPSGSSSCARTVSASGRGCVGSTATSPSWTQFSTAPRGAHETTRADELRAIDLRGARAPARSAA